MLRKGWMNLKTGREGIVFGKGIVAERFAHEYPLGMGFCKVFKIFLSHFLIQNMYPLIFCISCYAIRFNMSQSTTLHHLNKFVRPLNLYETNCTILSQTNCTILDLCVFSLNACSVAAFFSSFMNYNKTHVGQIILF